MKTAASDNGSRKVSKRKKIANIDFTLRAIQGDAAEMVTLVGDGLDMYLWIGGKNHVACLDGTALRKLAQGILRRLGDA